MTIVAPDVHTDNAPVGETIVSVGRVSKPVQVDASRYTDPAWARIEEERLWPATWQLACTIDHVSGPGDTHVYDVGRLSILIVRGDDGVLRAFQNVCRHRGMQLCNDHQRGLKELRCVFHRWSWNLAGELKEVPSRKGFGALRNEDFPLFGVKVDTWGPLVFVNPDLDAEPLADFLAPVPDDIAWADLDDFRCKALISIPVPSNWNSRAGGGLGSRGRRSSTDSAKPTMCREYTPRCCAWSTTSTVPRQSGNVTASSCSPTAWPVPVFAVVPQIRRSGRGLWRCGRTMGLAFGTHWRVGLGVGVWFGLLTLGLCGGVSSGWCRLAGGSGKGSQGAECGVELCCPGPAGGVLRRVGVPERFTSTAARAPLCRVRRERLVAGGAPARSAVQWPMLWASTAQASHAQFAP